MEAPGKPPGGRPEGSPWKHLLRTGLSWPREGLAAPGSAKLGRPGPTRFEAGRQVPAGLDRARLGCGEALAGLSAGLDLATQIVWSRPGGLVRRLIARVSPDLRRSPPAA